MPVQFTQWYTQNPYGAVTSEAQVQPEPFFRDALDRQRSAWRKTPEAEYPDGYLGTLRSRRDDKTMQFLQGTRLTQRNYQRGVHKGERIDPGDYMWPNFMNPQMRIVQEMEAGRYLPRHQLAGTTNEKLISEGKLPIPRGSAGVMTLIDPKRQEQLRRLAPSWNP